MCGHRHRKIRLGPISQKEALEQKLPWCLQPSCCSVAMTRNAQNIGKRGHYMHWLVQKRAWNEQILWWNHNSSVAWPTISFHRDVGLWMVWVLFFWKLRRPNCYWRINSFHIPGAAAQDGKVLLSREPSPLTLWETCSKASASFISLARWLHTPPRLTQKKKPSSESPFEGWEWGSACQCVQVQRGGSPPDTFLRNVSPLTRTGKLSGDLPQGMSSAQSRDTRLHGDICAARLVPIWLNSLSAPSTRYQRYN